MLQHPSKPAERNTFLFEPYPVAVLIAHERIEQGPFVRVERQERTAKRLVLLDPQGTVRQKRVVIHENGTDLGETGAAAIENGKTMGGEVAPVKNFTIPRPWEALQNIKQ